MVAQHMTKFHKDQLDEFKARGQSTTMATLSNAFSIEGGESSHVLVESTPTQQKRASTLLATWIAQSLRPLSAVEDPGFVAFVNYIARDIGGVALKMPGRTQLRSEI